MAAACCRTLRHDLAAGETGVAQELSFEARHIVLLLRPLHATLLELSRGSCWGPCTSLVPVCTGAAAQAGAKACFRVCLD